MIFRASKNDGYITVFLSLTFMVLLSLILVLVEGARSNGAKFMSEYAVDVGMDSILGEYHKELFNRYDLLFIDTAYGTGDCNIERVTEHMKKYVDRNLFTKNNPNSFRNNDLFGLSVNETVSYGASYITDNEGEVFRRQAEDERKQMLGIYILNDVIGDTEKEKIIEYEEKDYSSQRQDVENQINQTRNIKVKNANGEYEEIKINNPADGVNSKRGMGILLLAIKDTSKLSTSKIDLNERLSNRNINVGVGVNSEKYGVETPGDILIFKNYIDTYFGSYRNEKEKSNLKYEKEYIIAGKEGDIENLEAVAKRIFAIREASNIEYLLSDQGKRAAVKTVALAVSAVAQIPELAELIEYSILFAWAFAESVVDMRCIYCGGKIPLVKSDASWKTDLDGILSNSFMDYDGETGGEGMSYEDFLKSFLMIMDIKDQTFRALDIMELNIRQTKGNGGFRIDGCIEGLRITTNIISKNGDNYYLSRNCYY